MKRAKRILVVVGCAALLLISWAMALNVKSDEIKQGELLDQVYAYLEDDVYISAVPLLEEAVQYNTDRTAEAEELLKQAYLKLAASQQKYVNLYRELLETQMARVDAGPEVFLEAGQYYLSVDRIDDALNALRQGVERTGDENLQQFYEENRYGFTTDSNIYQDVTTAYNGAIQVKNNDLWGLASTDGTLEIPCEYDKLSTYSDGQCVAMQGNVISMVDINNNRTRLLHTEATDIGNFAENRTSLETRDGWILASGSFGLGSSAFEELGMFSGGYSAAKQNGKWGIVDSGGITWAISPEYDDVIRDELGRCYGENCVFVKKDGKVYLYSGQGIGSDPYEDARPFKDGWAAVKKNGKWGFIDSAGQVKIDYQFDDALSFSGHLAAVKVGDLWGYVSLLGEIVIEPQFSMAKSFEDGSAPVQFEDQSWRFITLNEEF